MQLPESLKRLVIALHAIGTNAGLEAARARGRKGDRPFKLDEKKAADNFLRSPDG
jgi:hypothetical protein